MDNPVFVDEEDIRKNVTGNLDLIDFNWFKLTADPKKGGTIFDFYNGDRWVDKKTGDFFAPKALRDQKWPTNRFTNGKQISGRRYSC